MTRGLLVSGFICNFHDAGSAFLLFPLQFPWCDFSAPLGRRRCCHRARPSGRDGRQDQDKIVRRHSLDRLNASMIEQKKVLDEVVSRLVSATIVLRAIGCPVSLQVHART